MTGKMSEYMQFLLIVNFAGFVISHYSCLTWEYKGNNLSLICRIQQEVQSVSFIDSNGKLQAKCTLNNLRSCDSFHTNGSIIVKSDKNEVIFIIKEYDSKRYKNGEWTCKQGNHILKTVVTKSTGIIADTDLILSGTVSSNLQSVKLLCFSCREPHGNIVEFLIDDRSEDVVRYNSVTKKCTHMNEECRPGTCSCTPSGNEFTRSFRIVDINKYTTFSCSMKFVDLDKSSRFLKYSSIVLRGKELIVNGSQTIITKTVINSHELNDEKRNVSDARNNKTLTSTDTVKAGDVLKWIGISVAFAMPLVVAVVIIFCCRLFRKSKNMGKMNSMMMTKFKSIEDVDKKETALPLIPQAELSEGIGEKETSLALITNTEKSDTESTKCKRLIKTMLDKWVEWDAHYYETIFSQKVKDALETNFCVTIIGAAGEGKTVTARHAALQYKYGNQPYTILSIDDPEELTKSIKLDKNQFVILEDPLGKQHLDEGSLQIWIQQSKKLRYSLMDSPIKIVVTMRKSIFRYYQTRIKDTIFHANVIDLSSESNRLSIEEKQGILEQNIKHSNSHIDSNIKQLILNESYYPGFPLMCYKLSADSELTKNRNLDPFPMILEHINEFSNSEPFRYHYCCLVLAFMHNCVFDINDFTLCQNADFAGDDETDKEKIENIIKSCHISSKDENCFSNLKNSFEALSGSFFAYKPPIYTILHESITRAVAYTYGIVNTRILLEYSNSAVIREFVRIKSDTNERMYSNEKIIIDPTCQKQLTNQLAKRFVCDIEQGNTSDVFRNPSCLNETFQIIFYKVLNKSDVLLQLMSRSPTQTKQSIRYSAHDTKCPFDNISSLSTPVHWLCSLGLKQILELVLSRSNNKTEFINSLPGRVKPLHIAAGHGHLEIVKYLIEDICVNVNEKLNANFKDDPKINERYTGCLPLHFAASRNFQDVVACLLQNKADPNLLNDHGCSPMMLAAGSGYVAVVDYIISYGGNPNLSCNNGTTPLMLAAQEGHFDTLLTLIDGKADVNLQNNEEKSKQSALFLAARNGRIQCVRKLIDKGADKELSDIHRTSPLLVALLNEKYETAKCLFQLGASINAKNIEGKSPLEVTKLLNINLFDQV